MVEVDRFGDCGSGGGWSNGGGYGGAEFAGAYAPIVIVFDLRRGGAEERSDNEVRVECNYSRIARILLTSFLALGLLFLDPILDPIPMATLVNPLKLLLSFMLSFALGKGGRMGAMTGPVVFKSDLREADSERTEE